MRKASALIGVAAWAVMAGCGGGDGSGTSKACSISARESVVGSITCVREYITADGNQVVLVLRPDDEMVRPVLSFMVTFDTAEPPLGVYTFDNVPFMTASADDDPTDRLSYAAAGGAPMPLEYRYGTLTLELTDNKPNAFHGSFYGTMVHVDEDAGVIDDTTSEIEGTF